MRYLDYAATTPVLDEVVEAMLPYLRGTFGNPSSVYGVGRDAKKGLEEARERTAAAVGAAPSEIVFTAGGTEADNLALKGGAFRARSMRRNGNHIITTAVEHHAVLHSAEWLEKQGFRVTFLPVDAEGVVDLDALASALGPETALVSIMLANNEVGTIQPLEAALRITRERSRALFHTDAVQALGKVPLNLEELGVDMASFAAHKVGGPKGTGALYVRPRPRSSRSCTAGARSGTCVRARRTSPASSAWEPPPRSLQARFSRRRGGSPSCGTASRRASWAPSEG
jgi:cysteine desulfurase